MRYAALPARSSCGSDACISIKVQPSVLAVRFTAVPSQGILGHGMQAVARHTQGCSAASLPSSSSSCTQYVRFYHGLSVTGMLVACRRSNSWWSSQARCSHHEGVSGCAREGKEGTSAAEGNPGEAQSQATPGTAPARQCQILEDMLHLSMWYARLHAVHLHVRLHWASAWQCTHMDVPA